MAMKTPRSMKDLKLGHRVKVLKQKMTNKDREEIADPAFDALHEKFSAHLARALTLRTALSRYVGALQGMAQATNDVGSEISSYYQGWTDAPPRAVSLLGQVLTDVHATCDSQVASSLMPMVSDWERYCGFLRTVEKMVADRTKASQEYAYYKEKVKVMRQKPPKDPQHLPKNEAKLDQAKSEYEDVNEVLTGLFNLIVEDASAAFGPLMHVLCKGATNIFAESYHKAQPLAPVVQTPDEYGCSVAEPRYKELLSKYPPEPLDKPSGGMMQALKAAQRKGSALRSSRSTGKSSEDADGFASGGSDGVNLAPPTPGDSMGGGAYDPSPPMTTTIDVPDSTTNNSHDDGAAINGSGGAPDRVPYDPVPPLPNDDELAPATIVDAVPASPGDLDAPPPLPQDPPAAAAGGGADEAAGAAAGDGGFSAGAQMAKALYDFAPQEGDELALTAGDRMQLLGEDEEGWWKVRLADGREGIVPHNYIERD